MQTTNFRDQFTDVADACALAQSIVDTVREPVLVLDKGLRVIAASRSFYSSFKVRPEDTQGRLLYTLGDGQWDIAKLRVLLEQILPEHGVMEGYEVEHEFPDIGRRTMYLNARQVVYKEGAESTILLGIEDVTERRALEREKDELLRQKEVMLEELKHRIANSLQIIAGIIATELVMNARRHVSENLQPFAADFRIEVRKPSQIAARAGNASDESLPHRIRYRSEYDWNGRRRFVQLNQSRRSKCQQHVGPCAQQFVGLAGEQLRIRCAPSIDKVKVASLAPSGGGKPSLEGAG